ncbi:MAG TPA: bacteriohopanetetrol glucosamine biosynthesis glycosyltransferase HpnI [Dongiaceae bacterium]|nr:bacteriohopanetetrol glucosamine biosynthesis glycosyltransferase HpnI [Dongiaceae bacterium]
MTAVSTHLLGLIGPAFLILAGAGSLYALAAVLLLRRFFSRPAPSGAGFPGVTILKPLHGAEPELYENLASFCRQDYLGPVQIILGLRDSRDPAREVVRRLMADLPGADLELVIDPSLHGANGKMSNLVNMARAVRHDVLVLADSDIRVAPHYLRQLVAALDEPGVGLATCLYRGLPEGGIWSRLAAMGINQLFLPSVLVGLGIGRADPCFGATIALRRETLRRIGGFGAFANHLADDHAIGEAVRRLGGKIAIPPMIVTHICRFGGARELLRQELRWALTLRLLDPAGFLGSAVTHPLPFALLGLALLPGHGLGLAVLGLCLASRLALQIEAHRVLALACPPWYLSPLRDLLSFAVFVASHFTDAVSWRGQRFRVRRDGTLIPAKDVAS